MDVIWSIDVWELLFPHGVLTVHRREDVSPVRHRVSKRLIVRNTGLHAMRSTRVIFISPPLTVDPASSGVMMQAMFRHIYLGGT